MTHHIRNFRSDHSRIDVWTPWGALPRRRVRPLHAVPGSEPLRRETESTRASDKAGRERASLRSPRHS